MSYRLYLNGELINHAAINLAWSSNKDTLGQELTFDMPFDDTRRFPTAEVKPNDKVSLIYDSELIFFGSIIDVEYTGRNPRKCYCLDLAFYLNKSKVTKQFNKINADEALRELLKPFGIKNNITNIPVEISKIYKAQEVSEIIKDILQIAEQQTGKKYRFEMRGDTFVVFVWTDIYAEVDVQWIENPTRKLSMENMKNRIEIVADNEKSTKVVAVEEDSNSIKTYGLLQESQTISEKDLPKAKTVAQNLLNDLNRLQESGSVNLLGDYRARAGRVITLNEPITGLQGDYFITDAQHNISNGIHTMTLTLEVV